MRARKATSLRKMWVNHLGYILQREQIINMNYIGGGTTYGITTMMRFSFAILMVFLFIIILNNSSALRLNEVESNPEGQDAGFEWVELYSQEIVSLEEYYLENGDGGVYNLSGSFSGFFVVLFSKQFLDNSNETVYLKNNGQTVDTVGPFRDNKKERTYNFCEDIWIFATSTNNEANSCPGSSQSPTPNQNEETPPEEQRAVNAEENQANLSIQILKQEQPKIEKIILGNPVTSEKSFEGEITKTYRTRIGVVYFFMALCVLLVILIALRKL